MDIVREQKQLLNMKVTVIQIIIGTIEMVPKGLVRGLKELEIGARAEIIRTTALLRSTRILRRVLETWGDLLSLRLQWKTKASVENSQEI